MTELTDHERLMLEEIDMKADSELSDFMVDLLVKAGSKRGRRVKQAQAKAKAEYEAQREADYQKYLDDEAKAKAMVERAKAILAENGFVLKVNACGCCDSPWIHLTYHGEPIIHDVDDPSRDLEGVVIK